MSKEIKSKEEIFDNIATEYMVQYNLYDFIKTYPTLYGVIIRSMDDYAEQESCLFAEWIADGPWVKVPPLEDYPENVWYIPSEDNNVPCEEATTTELYQLYLKVKNNK